VRTELEAALLLHSHWRQILKPALGLNKSLDLGRHRPWVKIVDNKDHDREAAFELVQLG
jgi:hypothetical protein